MGRRVSRETVMKLLYQIEIRKDDREEQIREALEEDGLSESDRKYIGNIANGVCHNISYIDNLIKKYAKGWKIGRISKVDLSILRLSIYEINYRSDIPFSVSVNEAVELAKKYSSEDAGSFINGILSKIPKPEQPHPGNQEND